MNKNKKIIVALISFILIGGGAFYAGVKYTEAKNLKTMQDKMLGMRGGNRTMRLGGQGGGFVSGEILSKDSTSITVKLRDGGSQIIFFTDATPVMKSVNGTQSDLTLGEQVMIAGTKNPDGSMIAQSIQIRPAQAVNQPHQ